MDDQISVRDRVLIPWGLSEVEGRAVEIYGTGLGRRVVVELEPERSGYVVSETTTVTMPIVAVKRATHQRTA